MISSRIPVTILALVLLSGNPIAAQKPSADKAPTEPDKAQAALDELCTLIKQQPGNVTERQVNDAIDQAAALGRPYVAEQAIRIYLATRPKSSAVLRRKAIDSARRVGDYNTAIVRSKSYLDVAQPGTDAAQVAALMYRIQIDLLDRPDDAYRTMSSKTDRLCTGTHARKLDEWYLNQALVKKDYVNLARRLADIYSAGLPPVQTEALYTRHVDALLSVLSTPAPEKLAAVPHLARLGRVIQGDDRTKNRCLLTVETLKFASVTDKKTAVPLEKEFAPVLAAAKAYLAAISDADSLADIMLRLGRAEPLATKQQFFADSFKKLNAAQQRAVVQKPGIGTYTSPEHWSQLATSYPAAFRGITAVPFSYVTTADCKRLAPAVEGAKDINALIIRTLASGGDFTACLDRLVTHDAWHQENYQNLYYHVIRSHLRNRFIAARKAEKVELPAQWHGKSLARFGAKHIATTPLAFDQLTGREFLYSVLTAEPASVAVAVDSLAWVPYTEAQRKYVFGNGYHHFTNWANVARRQQTTLKAQVAVGQKTVATATSAIATLKAAKPANANAIKAAEARLKAANDRLAQTREQLKAADTNVALIGSIDSAFKRAMQAKAPDISKAPNPLCRDWAKLLLAVNAKDAKAYVAAGRSLYPQVKDFRTKKTPFGKLILKMIVTPPKGLDVFDFQLEVLADQLKTYDPNLSDHQKLIGDLTVQVLLSHTALSKSPANTEKLNIVFADALSSRLDAGKFAGWLFSQVIATRSDQEPSVKRLTAIVEKMIQRDVLASDPWRYGGRFATTSYMYFLRTITPQLAKKFPPTTFFDAAFLKEAAREGWVDNAYFTLGGQDKDRKIRNLAADFVTKTKKLPVDARNPQPCTLAEFRQMQLLALGAEPAKRDAMLAQLAKLYGSTRFEEFAMGQAELHLLGDLKKPEARAKFFAKLSVYLDRAAQSSQVVPMIGVTAINYIDPAVPLTDKEIDVLLRLYSPECAVNGLTSGGSNLMLRKLLPAIVAAKRENELFLLAPYLWKTSLVDHSLQIMIVNQTIQSQKGGKSDLAATLSGVGLELFGTRIRESELDRVRLARAQAMLKVGGVASVDRSNPSYRILAAQSDYLGGNFERAWQGYVANRQLAVTAIEQLDPAFAVWLIDRNTSLSEFAAAEAIAREALQKMESQADLYSTQARGHLLLAYADIALARPEHPRARALYGRISTAKEFAGSRTQVLAELRIADVDRKTKHYVEALDRLEKLTNRKDAFARREGHFYKARILFDQEQYTEARKEIEAVFNFDPTHAEARILEGRVNLQVKRLEPATQINVGFLTDRQIITPGDPLRVSLRDQALSIAGGAATIEIRAWTESGDEEHFRLSPFAGSRTRFEGRLSTEMGPIVKNDRKLQLLGGDRVFYDFSEKFKKAHNIKAKANRSMTVLSDASLFASSGTIRTQAELERLSIEQAIRLQISKGEKEKQSALSDLRRFNQIKPGNPINVRVVDPDQNTTAEIDQLSVMLSTTSGDRVTVQLKETGPHTGIFDGAISTSSAPAAAMASDSEAGSLPLHAISAGTHPAWVAQRDDIRPKTFAVDLNASEGLGKMTIDTSVPGRNLKQFVIQTSVDGSEFETVGSWPSSERVWDGKVRLQRTAVDSKARLTIADMRRALEIAPIESLKSEQLKEFGTKLRAGPKTEVMHIAAAFHLPTRKMIVLRLKPDTQAGSAQYYFLVDGRLARQLPVSPGAAKSAERPIEFKGVLGQGVHRLDIFIRANANSTVAYELLRNTDKPPYVEPCPMDMFDPDKHSKLAEYFANKKTTVTAAKDGGSFDVAFGPEIRARVVRLLLADFETDAPAIKKITLSAKGGRVLLPTKVDLMALKKNDVLEVVPGDKVSVVYRDARVVSKQKQVREAFLSATYANGSITAALLTGYGTSADGLREPEYIGLRRFKPEDTIVAVIRDADADTSDQLDVVEFLARTGDGTPVRLKALETNEHSGVFLGKLFVVHGAPQRKSEIQVAEGEDLILSYLDQENTEPGIPWERTAVAQSVVYVEPQLRVFDTVSSPLAAEQLILKPKNSNKEEFFPTTRTLAAIRPPESAAKPAKAIVGGPLLCELVWPTIAQTSKSSAEIYVQTSTGRKNYGRKPAGEFDIDVPGTIRIHTAPSSAARAATPRGYRNYVVAEDPNALDALDDGRFTFSIPMRLGRQPTESYAKIDPEAEDDESAEDYGSVVVRGDDEIYIGFKYSDQAGKTRWITRSVSLTADPFFDAMNRQHSELTEGLFVGQSVYFRVIDPARDSSDERDRIEVMVTGADEKQHPVELVETFEHSGVFKGPIKFRYADAKAGVRSPGAVGVTYGQQVTASYRPQKASDPLTASLTIYKGSDGDIQPFTKRFADPLTAVRTRLTIAESYFELAKKHRQLGKPDLSAKEIADGKRLLEEALRDYPDTEARAQVDYLLANLSLEAAREAEGAEAKKKFYNEALSRFTSIVSNYRDSSYAPKAQFKKALTLEQMGEIDLASEEYVKLSYRWPDSPLIAETIARLGQYFFSSGMAAQTVAKQKETEAQSKLELAGAAQDVGKAEELRAVATTLLVESTESKSDSIEKFTTAAKVFGRLSVRFPTHRLASKTTALSGQCFMRAEMYDDAVKAFQQVVDNDKADTSLRAESLYWSGDSHLRKIAARRGSKDSLRDAYLVFKNLTLYYPESKWARFARGRLAEDNLAAFDTQDKESK